MKKPKKAKRKAAKKASKPMVHASFCKCKKCIAEDAAIRAFLKTEVGGND